MFPLRDSTPGHSIPVITIILIIINIMVFYLVISSGSENMEMIVYIFGLIPAYLKPDELSVLNYYPFLSSMFLHGSWMHVIGNMWILWLFGDNVEDHMGHIKFLLFYIVCGLLAGLTHYITNPQSVLPVVGASGAVAGVMGAYFLMFKKAKILTYIPPIFLISIPAWIYLGIWILTQVYCGTADLFYARSCGLVAFWAHVGGFIAGMLLYKVFLHREPGYYDEKD